jgi:CRISPR-associated endoribonuclease Cas6
MQLSHVGQNNLYAFYLKLRPIQHGTLMPFNGELVHAAWLDWLRSATPDVATWLHEGNKRRLFTCSSLKFPYPSAKMRDAERRNVHLPLDPLKTYTIRVTLLVSQLFPIFHDILMSIKNGSAGIKNSPFIQLSKQTFLLEEVIIDAGEQSGWTGTSSFHDIVEQVRMLHLGKLEHLQLEFNSLTTFSRGSVKQTDSGNYYARIPWPSYVFPGLAKRWAELAPPEYVGYVQRERIEEYALNEAIFITDYDLKVHTIKFTTHTQPGFIGTCNYALCGPDDPPTDAAPFSTRQQIILLSHLAFYSGIGYKTAMGMGQARMYKC